LCFRLKQNEKTSHIPVLILSGQHRLCNRVKCFYFGADDYLTFPFLLVELQIRVHNLIQSRKLLQQKYSAQWNSKPTFNTNESTDKLFLQRALAVVEDNLTNSQFGSELFAKGMGLSQRHLSRKLISLSGTPANQFIRKVRLLRAGELLATDAGTVREVAYQVGFHNLSYFTKCFKALHKSLPHEYAKRSAA
jgi:AraC-like DNA-binding protein